jgi:predicted Zn finger-like uncharacterized protein
MFIVAAEQLKAAHGNVRCGTCLESFDAIPHLSDGPMQARPPAHADTDGVDIDIDMDFEPHIDTGADVSDRRSVSERLSSTLAAARAAASEAGAPVRAHVASALAGALPADGPARSGDPDDAAHAAVADEIQAPVTPAARQGNTASHRRVSLSDESLDDPNAGLPEVLRADAEEFAAQRAARRRAIGYGGAALMLLVLLAGQYVFFMPEDAARRYPQFRSAIESACIRIGCVLPERRDPGRIRVVSRDVRAHPGYEGVMQIKATLTNSAPFRQPYPRVRFTLFNVNGQTIATRVFQPSEYLGRSVAASARLRPKTPFQMELDVLAPGEAAVSFEFQFL